MHARVQVEAFVLCGIALLAATPARVVVIASVGGLRGRNAKAARREGHFGAGVEGRGRFGNVGSLLLSAGDVKYPLAIEPANDALGHAPHDALEIAATWRIGRKETRSAVVEREDSIEPDHVKVWVQVETATEPLYACDGSRARRQGARAAPVVGRHRLVEDARHGRQHVGTEGGEAPEPNNPRAETLGGRTTATKLSRDLTVDLEDELRSAAQDFERGDYIELTDEQLARCIATGESPWPDESRS